MPTLHNDLLDSILKTASNKTKLISLMSACITLCSTNARNIAYYGLSCLYNFQRFFLFLRKISYYTRVVTKENGAVFVFYSSIPVVIFLIQIHIYICLYFPLTPDRFFDSYWKTIQKKHY